MVSNTVSTTAPTTTATAHRTSWTRTFRTNERAYARRTMPRVYDLHDVQLPIDSGTVGEFVFKDNAKVFPQRPLRAPQPQAIRPRRTPVVQTALMSSRTSGNWNILTTLWPLWHKTNLPTECVTRRTSPSITSSFS